MRLFERKRQPPTPAEKQRASDLAEKARYVVDDEVVVEGFKRATARVEQEMLDVLRGESPDYDRLSDLRADLQALQRLKGAWQGILNDGHMAVAKRQSDLQ